MKRLVRIGIFACFLFGSDARGQDFIGTEFLQPPFPTSFSYLGVGARSMGLGGAYLGVSDDPSALSWNPAGLSMFDRPVLSLAWGSFRPRGSFSSITIGQGNQNSNLSGLSQAALLVPVRIKGHHFVGSFNYHTGFDEFREDGSLLRMEVPSGNPDDTVPSNYSAHTVGKYETAAKVFSFGFGTRVFRSLHFGPAINIYTGNSFVHILTDYRIDRQYQFQDGQYRRFRVHSGGRDSIKFSGLNFTLGLKYISPKLTTGLVVKTPFTLKMEADSRLETDFFLNDLPSDNVPDLLEDNVLRTISMPLFIGGGIGYNVTPRWLVASDVEYRNFSSSEFKVQSSFVLTPDGKTERTFVTFDPESTPALAHMALENVLSFRIGTEYQINTKSSLFPIIPVRLGARLETLPSPEVTATFSPLGVLESVSTKAITSKTLSMGVGLTWSQVRLDAGYSYTSYDRNYLMAVGLLVSEDSSEPPVEFVEPINSQVRDHKFGLTFTGYF